MAACTVENKNPSCRQSAEVSITQVSLTQTAGFLKVNILSSSQKEGENVTHLKSFADSNRGSNTLE